MTKEEEQFAKRMTELANTAYRRGIPVFTGFLELNQLHILHSLRTFPDGIRVETFGGYAYAERQMAAFLPDAPFFYDADGKEAPVAYPFTALQIAPLHPKYADVLTHRDFLGAVLHLGIDRAQIGDLLVEAQRCTLFCTPQIADFLVEECTRVKHTVVACTKIPLRDFSYTPRFLEKKGSVSSVRLDAVLALAFQTSRSGICPHIAQGDVSVNSRAVTSASAPLSKGDLVSVRGFGKFRYDGILSETKKGRYMIQVSVFQ